MAPIQQQMGRQLAEDELGYKRKFLVFIDENPECDRAVTFAAHRVRRTGGVVVLLAVIDSEDFGHFLGVEDVMRQEARDEAERQLAARVARIAQIGNIRTETIIREGNPAEEIEALAQADPGIAILVLAAGGASEGPGPLINHFSSHNRLHIMVTIVPGAMTDAEIIAVA